MSDIFDQITSLENLFASWQEFRCGKRGKTDVKNFERNLEDNIWQLHTELRARGYRHGPYQRFLIADPKPRVIHKALVRDRLLHHALVRVLYPILDRSFIGDSYSGRFNKGTHAGVRRLALFARRASANYRRPCWALKFDVAKFFNSIDHATLLDVLSQKISCPSTQQLLAEIVGNYRASAIVGGGSHPRLKDLSQNRGLPIGSVTSQLFANVYLNAFDHFIKDELRLRNYVRYTDDALVLSDNPGELRTLIPIISTWLWHYRRLTLHPHKVSLRKLIQGVDFVGYVARPHYRVLRTRTKQRMFKRANSTNLTSYLGVLRHCSGHKLRQQLLKLLY